MLLNNVTEKFAKARELCPGMSEEVYALTDYLATVANDSLVPEGILIMLVCAMDDLEKKRCGFAKQSEFPKYLAEHSLQVRAQMPYILQVVDAIAEQDFAEAVRAKCKMALNWDVPKRVNITDKVSEHEYINAAVNWWTEAIQHPKMDNGTDEMSGFMMLVGGGMSKRQLTEAELRIFREKLAEGILEEMKEMGGRVTLDVDYSPDRILSEAGAAIGLGPFSYPCKTTMWISKIEVSVCAGYGAPEQIVWFLAN